MSSAFQIFITRDGSPTLVWPGQNGAVEKMHHSDGALSESLYIYHQALNEVLGRGWPVRVLSLGLGLGYNELITLAQAHKSGREDLYIWSFEASSLLRDGFQAWLQDTALDPDLARAFTQAAAGVAATFDLSLATLKDIARNAFASGRLELRGKFPDDTSDIGACTCVYYDAFSKKLSPDLWIEEDIARHLESMTAAGCVLATYASTGALNRALKRLGFRLCDKKGFSGKRESTLAIRE
jgi:tRNA U34 5-methylaminomethyl-2-thiouridine-forming methyltransferase MnmC